MRRNDCVAGRNDCSLVNIGVCGLGEKTNWLFSVWCPMSSTHPESTVELCVDSAIAAWSLATHPSLPA